MVFVVGATAACGLGPGPATAGPGADTATAPWTELGAPLVCVGDEALAAPSAAVGGLCVSNDAPAKPCVADGDCGSREACVCGRCTVAYCAVASDCEGDRACNFSQHRCDRACTESRDCGDVENCIAGVCRGRCGSNADCQHGEACDGNHVCSATSCAADAGCLGGERCEIQRDPRQILEPSPVAADDGTIVLYLDLALPNLPDQRAIWRATSRDGLHFTVDPAQPILDEAGAARAPSAIVVDGMTYLYYEADGAIRVATSPDGRAFGASVAALSLGGMIIHAPGAVSVDGEVYVYYERADGSLGLAIGQPGAALTDHGEVLAPVDVQVGSGTPGTAFWTPVTRLASPHAIVAGPAGGQTIHLYFSGFGTESAPAQQFGTSVPIPPNFSVGFAAAQPSDPATLSPWPYGPVADEVEGFLDHRDELDPAVVGVGDDRFFLYYVDATHDPTMSPTVEQIGRLGALGAGP